MKVQNRKATHYIICDNPKRGVCGVIGCLCFTGLSIIGRRHSIHRYMGLGERVVKCVNDLAVRKGRTPWSGTVKAQEVVNRLLRKHSKIYVECLYED